MVCRDHRVPHEDVIDVVGDCWIEARTTSTAGDYCDTFGWHFEGLSNITWDV